MMLTVLMVVDKLLSAAVRVVLLLTHGCVDVMPAHLWTGGAQEVQGPVESRAFQLASSMDKQVIVEDSDGNV